MFTSDSMSIILDKIKENNLNQLTFKQIREEFKNKTDILHNNLAPVSPFQLYSEIFHDDLERDFVYVIDNKTYKVAKGYDELMEIAGRRSDVYMSLTSAYGNSRKKDLLKELFAFVVDIDHITPNDLKDLLKKIKSQPKKIQPSFLVNSGQGLHIYYALSQPVQCYARVVDNLSKMQSALEDIYANDQATYKIDKHYIAQSYRIFGSLTKIGELTRGFTVNNKPIEIEDIAAWLGTEWKEIVFQSAKQQPIKSTIKPVIKTNSTTKKTNVIHIPNQKPSFYSHVLGRMRSEVNEGHRYTALLALVVAGWKCRVSRDRVEHDVHVLIEYYNSRDNSKIKPTEFDKAMLYYCSRSTNTKSTTLEKLLGFNFQRNTKRNGLTQAEHLANCNAAKTDRILVAMREYLKINPNASQAQTARDLKISRHTAIKYFNVCRESQSEQGFALAVHSIAYNTALPPERGFAVPSHLNLNCAFDPKSTTEMNLEIKKPSKFQNFPAELLDSEKNQQKKVNSA